MIELEPVLLRIPLEPPLSAGMGSPPQLVLEVPLVRVSSEDATSYGEALLDDPAALPVMVDFFADCLANAGPRDYGLLWQRMAGLLREYEPQPMRDHVAVLGALDMALWDLAGRELGVPCWQLAGGLRTRQVDCYAGGLAADDPGLVDRARQLRKQFGALGLSLTGEVARDVRALKEVRRAVGEEAPLLVDAEGRYGSVEEAKTVGGALERSEVFWYEEPLPAGHWEEYRALREPLATPLAAGKRLWSLQAFDAALQGGALDVAVADLRVCGGVSAGLRVAQLAQLHGARVTFHCGLSPLAQIASAHLVAAQWQGGPLQVQPAAPQLTGLVEPAPVFAQGFLRVPQEPGLGALVNEEFVDKYRVEWPEDE